MATGSMFRRPDPNSLPVLSSTNWSYLLLSDFLGRIAESEEADPHLVIVLFVSKSVSEGDASSPGKRHR
jgi:hypothetical protein